MHDVKMETFIQDIVRHSGEAVLPLFGKEKAQYQKSENRGDVVTKADLLSEEMMIQAIQKAYPDHGIISEERGRINADAEYVWIMDPVDGTLNFASDMPLWGVMLALAHHKEVQLSAIYLPVMDEMLFARRGQGAFLNGRQIHCSDTKELGRSIGFIPSRAGPAFEFYSALIEVLRNTDAILAGYGCIAATTRYIATGDRDWNVSFGGGMYDYAATSLVLEESGCTVSDITGKPWTTDGKGLVAANPTLYPALWAIVQKAHLA